MAKRTNDVVEIKKNGAKLMDDIANNKLIDELNWSGDVNELKSIFIPAVWANVPKDIPAIINPISFIIIYQLNEWIDWLIQSHILFPLFL